MLKQQEKVGSMKKVSIAGLTWCIFFLFGSTSSLKLCPPTTLSHSAAVTLDSRDIETDWSTSLQPQMVTTHTQRESHRADCHPQWIQSPGCWGCLLRLKWSVWGGHIATLKCSPEPFARPKLNDQSDCRTTKMSPYQSQPNFSFFSHFYKISKAWFSSLQI